MNISEKGETWHLAQVRPNSFRIAQRNLVRQGFTVFCPTQSQTRRRAGRFVTQQTPLFPGYLFIAFDPARAPWRSINSTYGVSRLVTFGELPSPAPAELVAGLMARCDAEGQLLPPDLLRPGDNVHVLSGPFAQFVATIETVEPNRRVWILLDLLGRPTRVAVDPQQLQKA